MSGAEFLAAVGLAASIAQLIDSTRKVINRVRQYKQGSAFGDILPQLELFLNDVSRASQHFSSQQNADDEASRTFLRVLSGCNRQMIALYETISSVTPSTTSSSLRRTWMSLKSIGKDATIRDLIAILDRYRATLTLHMVCNITHQVSPISAAGLRRNVGIFEIPRQRVVHFVGRKNLLQSLKSFVLSNSGEFNPSDPALPLRIAVLVGLGGQGKTQTALELCRQCMDSFHTIIWINASSRIAALSDVKKIVRKVSTEFESSHDVQAMLSFFHQWLRELVKPWMLVFDNYDDPIGFPDIMNFYPDHGSVIITSRHQSSKRLGVAFEVGALTDEEGVELLLRSVKDEDQGPEFLAEARRVVAKLGHLALAIDQAASYISARQMSLPTFVELFESRKKAILAHTPATWEYRTQTDNKQALSAFTTWELSINQVASNEVQRELITDFLTLLAFLESNSVKESLFSVYVEQRPRAQQNQSLGIFLSLGKWDSATFQDLVMSLVDLALVQSVDYDDGYLLLSLHPVIKDWLQLRISSSKQEMMVQDTVDLLAIYITANDALDLSYRSRAALLKHVDAALFNTTQFLKTADSQLAHGGYIQGQQAVFATFYGKHDRTAEAETLFLRVLSLQDRYLGSMHIGTLATTNNLASLYLRLQRYEEAERLLRKVLEGKERLFPSNDFRIANTINELGNVCSQLGRCEEARSLFLRNLATFLGGSNPSINSLKIVYNNLGEVAMRQRNLEEAEQMLENALAQGMNGRHTCKLLFPQQREDSLDEIDCQILLNKARLLNCIGRFDLALVTCEKASQGLVSLLGPKHSKAVAAEKELANMFLNKSKATSVEKLQQSQKCDLNPDIRVACANWGGDMQQAQGSLMDLNRRRVQNMEYRAQTQPSTLQEALNGYVAMPNSSLLMSNQPRPTTNVNQGAMAQQRCFPFVSGSRID